MKTRAKKTRWLVVALSVTVLLVAIVACGVEEQSSLEEQAQSIDKGLWCPICPGETIDQAQVQLAHQMRLVVREKLAEGWSREQVLQFFVDRYGEGVLVEPPKEGFSLVAWLVPLTAVAAAALLLVFIITAMRRNAGYSRQNDVLAEQELEPYLALADRELSILTQGSSGPKRKGEENG